MTEPSLPPGPSTPRALQTLRWIARPTAMLDDCQRRYGDMFKVKLANEGTWIFISHPDAIKQVFTGDPRLLHAGEGNAILLPVLGSHSVLLLDEAAHMAQRKLLLPPFHGERMRSYAETMRTVAERTIDSWPQGKPFKVWHSMQAITLEVIMRTVFGVDDESRLSPLSEAVADSLRRGISPRQLGLVTVLGPQRLAEASWFQRNFEHSDRLIYEEIARRREAPDLEQREDILSMLLQARHEDGSPMSDRELRDELMTLLIAGHETTASSLAWAVERLVRHPEMIERLRDEAAAGEDEYADAVIKETLRLRPILALVLRKLTAPMEIGGRLLPAGVTVAPSIYLVQRRPEIYPEPLRFRPERFLEGQGGTYSWIPYGGGVRRCLGASFAQFEMKIVLQALVSKLSLQVVDPRSEPRRRRAITMVPARGGEVLVQPLRSAPVSAEPAEQAAAA